MSLVGAGQRWKVRRYFKRCSASTRLVNQLYRNLSNKLVSSCAHFQKTICVNIEYIVPLYKTGLLDRCGGIIFDMELETELIVFTISIET